MHKDDASFTEKSATKRKHILHLFYVAEKDDKEDGIAQTQLDLWMDDTLLNQVKEF